MSAASSVGTLIPPLSLRLSRSIADWWYDDDDALNEGSDEDNTDGECARDGAPEAGIDEAVEPTPQSSSVVGEYGESMPVSMFAASSIASAAAASCSCSCSCSCSALSAGSIWHVPFSMWYLSPFGLRYDLMQPVFYYYYFSL